MRMKSRRPLHSLDPHSPTVIEISELREMQILTMTTAMTPMSMTRPMSKRRRTSDMMITTAMRPTKFTRQDGIDLGKVGCQRTLQETLEGFGLGTVDERMPD